MAKKTLKTREVINAYNVINTLKLQKLENEEVISILHIKRKMRPVVKAYEELVEDARKNVVPENIEDITRKLNAQEQLTDPENKALIDAEKRLKEILEAEQSKEVELELGSLSESTLVKLFKDCELATKDEDLIYFLFE